MAKSLIAGPPITVKSPSWATHLGDLHCFLSSFHQRPIPFGRHFRQRQRPISHLFHLGAIKIKRQWREIGDLVPSVRLVKSHKLTSKISNCHHRKRDPVNKPSTGGRAGRRGRRPWPLPASRFALLCQCSPPTTTAIARPRSGLYCRLSTDLLLFAFVFCLLTFVMFATMFLFLAVICDV
jgi:hypothetical protein